jgi:alpha-L-rhamnosidase
MLVASSSFPHRTEFECSDDTVNALFKICKNSDLSNFYYFPMDCPQREKNGWTGDASESIEHMMLLYAPEKSLIQWYDSILAAQDDRGAFPGIVPTGGWGFKWGNGPAWDRIVTNLPYYVYKYTHNIEPANKAFPYILKYLKYLASRRSECGTLNIGLGDYCQFGRPADKPTTPIEFTDTVVAFDICKKALELVYRSEAGTLRPTDELLSVRQKLREFATKLADELRSAAREKFLDKNDMSLAGGTQTAQAFGLEYGIFDDCEKKAAVERLVKEIEKDGGHMNFGFLGSRVTFHALANGGYTELAYKLITQESAPSYGSIVKRGFTSLPERFETPTDKYPHASFNHHFFGDITHWFVKNVLGLSVNPECRDANSVTVSPCVIADINYASGERQMPNGRIRIEWKRDGERIVLNVKYSGGISISFNERAEFTSSVVNMKENEITIEYRKA